MALLCRREDILRLDHNQKDYYLKWNELFKSHEKLNLTRMDPSSALQLASKMANS